MKEEEGNLSVRAQEEEEEMADVHSHERLLQFSLSACGCSSSSECFLSWRTEFLIHCRLFHDSQHGNKHIYMCVCVYKDSIVAAEGVEHVTLTPPSLLCSDWYRLTVPVSRGSRMAPAHAALTKRDICSA